MRRILRRSFNAFRKLRAGLTLFGENVSPEVRNDLYIAHLSLYHFFSSRCLDARVLDVGCGAGYGALYLQQTGAKEVVGIDIDKRNIRYALNAAKSCPAVRFVHGDAQRLPSGLGQFDVVVSSNAFEHLHDVESALAEAGRSLRAGGGFILAVPPIVDDLTLKANQAISYHRTNLTIAKWYELLSSRFARVRTFSHLPPDGHTLDFTDPFDSTLTPDMFHFTEVEPLQYSAATTLTALFECVGCVRCPAPISR